MRLLPISLCLALASCASFAAEISTVKVYVDTDICAHLLLGSINTSRIDCTQKSFKQGSDAVLVRLSDNLMLEPNKQKLVKDYVGQLAEATGELKVKDGRIKLESIKPIQAESIPKGDPSRKMLDVRTYTAKGAALHEKIRHELAMMAYISEFDFISFNLDTDGNVVLTGWTVRQTNRSEAQGRLKNIEGVNNIVNNIEVLPLGSLDMGIRANARAKLQRLLPRYFWGSGSDIKIIVRNGVIILLGSVATKADSDVATIQCNSVPSAFKVVNLLRVVEPKKS
jgi:hypothetical protein